MAYEVHIDVFDGPFDLLLQLITAQQVDVYEVSLSEVVDAFCAEIARAAELDLEIATEFLLIAATLVELKCRRLLPGDEDIELDEELSIFEARDYLLARLVECRMFTAAAHALYELEQDAQLAHARRAGPDERFSGVEADLLKDVTPIMLGDLASRALAPRPVEHVDSSHVHVDTVTVSEVLDDFAKRLPNLGRTTLRELTVGVSKARVVASFLALLELYKQGLIDLEQPDNFGELAVCWSRGSLGATEVADEVKAVDEYDAHDVETVA